MGLAQGGKRMNAGRYVGASVVVFIVRTVLNSGFYGFLMHGEYDTVNATHPGVFREVIPAYVATDLVAAFLITYLIVRAAAAFGGGTKGAATLAVLLALVGPVLFSVYYFWSVTFYTPRFFVIETIFQLVSYAIQGAIAAAIYKTAPVAGAAGARPAV
jgi:hypothetical protein